MLSTLHIILFKRCVQKPAVLCSAQFLTMCIWLWNLCLWVKEHLSATLNHVNNIIRILKVFTDLAWNYIINLKNKHKKKKRTFSNGCSFLEQIYIYISLRKILKIKKLEIYMALHREIIYKCKLFSWFKSNQMPSSLNFHKTVTKFLLCTSILSKMQISNYLYLRYLSKATEAKSLSILHH